MKNPKTTLVPTFLTHIIARIDGVLGIATMPLELVCCKKRPKIVPDQLLVWEIRAL
jgi:hypothetical protein